MVLTKVGINTVWAKNGQEAINKCNENIDLILMDINLLFYLFLFNHQELIHLQNSRNRIMIRMFKLIFFVINRSNTFAKKNIIYP